LARLVVPCDWSFALTLQMCYPIQQLRRRLDSAHQFGLRAPVSQPGLMCVADDSSWLQLLRRLVVIVLIVRLAKRATA